MIQLADKLYNFGDKLVPALFTIVMGAKFSYKYRELNYR